MSNMATNKNGAEFGGSKSGKMKLKRLKTREEMSGVDDEEDYHTGVAASVPFMWESEPGTPKDKFRDGGDILSPLTPPPAFFSATTPRSPSPSPRPLRSYNRSSRTNFLNTVFRKLSVKATLHPPSLPSSSSSSSSSTSSSTPTSSRRERGRAGSPRRSSFEDDQEEEEEEEEEEASNEESPVSTLFFGRGATGRGCCPKLAKVFTRDFK